MQPSGACGPGGPAITGPSLLSAPASPPYTEQNVREMIAALYSPAAGVTPVQANEFLVDFQQHASAWPICISFLNHFALSSQSASPLDASDECILYFAAQTLAAQARAGFPQQLSLVFAERHGGALGGCAKERRNVVSSIFKELREGLLHLLVSCRRAPKPVVRQLAVALSAALVFGACGGSEHGGDRDIEAASGGDDEELKEEIALDEVLVPLGQKLGEQAAAPLLELLAALPQEVSSQRLSLSKPQRLAVLSALLQRHASSALAAAASVFDFLERREQALLSSPEPAAAAQISSLKSGKIPRRTKWRFPDGHCCQSVHVKMSQLPHKSASPVAQGAVDAGPRALSPETIDGLQAAADAVAALAALATAVANEERGEDDARGRGDVAPHEGPSSQRGGEADGTHCIRQVMEAIVHGYAVGCEALQQEERRFRAPVDADRLQAFSAGLIELAKEVLPAFFHGDPWPLPPSSVSAPSSHPLVPALEHICAFAADTLVPHPSLEVKEIGLDFHYNFLFHFMSLVSQQQELSQNLRSLQQACLAEHQERRARASQSDGCARADGTSVSLSADGAAPEADGASSAAEDSVDVDSSPAFAAAKRIYDAVAVETEERRQRLLHVYLHFLDVLLGQLGAPSADAVVDERVDLERWSRFRDEAAVNLTEATLVVGHARLLEKTKEELGKILALAAVGPADSANGDSAGAATNLKKAHSAEASLPWQRLEACLFVLTTVAPRAPAGEDMVIPLSLDLLPRLPYETALDLGNAEAVSGKTPRRSTGEERETAALFLHAAAGRFILWTAGYIGTQTRLFASLIHFLTCTALPFVIRVAQRQKAALHGEAAVCKLRELAEEVLVEAVKALDASAAPMLAEEAATEDVNLILNSIVSLILEESLSIDSRASLVLAAGAVLAPMPADRMRTLHRQLLSSLGQNLREVLAQPDSSTAAYRNAVKLFFSAVQSLRPSYALPLPPHAADLCEPIPKDSPYRHPVLDVTQELWETIEVAMRNSRRQEHLYEQSTYAIVAVISTCRAHVPRYLILFRFLDVLAETFAVYPTAYHLGALRTLEGLFGSAPEEPILSAVCDCLRRCVLATLERINVEGEHYVYRQPDLVGMTVDCVNIALLHPLLAIRFLQSSPTGVFQSEMAGAATDPRNWFCTLALAVLQFAPTCHHPKVLHTFMVFFSRLAGWTDPPSQLHAFDRGGSIPWLLEAAEKTQQAVLALLVKPEPPAFSQAFPRGKPDAAKAQGDKTYAAVAIHAIIQALASVHSAIQSWIGNAAQALLLLLHHPALAEQGRAALEASVMLAEDAKAQFQRSKFCAVFPSGATPGGEAEQ
ncbi:conserved hypothetical protein [Neospora caninum Liverpool]|uniref:Uncharacterized protein n=1 Tax=Neospora caninum (strain Liverpool) TaxID=572307 RepID=F0VFB4_NEOCL|nr:conserved hypothetical protein [Neospora caninum Liverpool]CBZ52408.1 conserved hypothetical protein [Neospora caninum Liverpool]|eukprot:XP_003882440.1 conserved hypothetical protein [Neospora caninum Liverpool]